MTNQEQPRQCGIEDCDKKHYGLGFCHNHYMRLPQVKERNRKRKNEYEKRWNKTPKGRKLRQKMDEKRRTCPIANLKRRAKDIVRYYRIRGGIKREVCEVCRSPDSVAHHDSYLKEDHLTLMTCSKYGRILVHTK